MKSVMFLAWRSFERAPRKAVAVIAVTVLGLIAWATSQGSIVQDFITALNSKDPALLQQFVAVRFDEAVSPEVRTKRIMGLVEQGAPFKLVRIVKEDAKEVRAEVEDRHGEHLGWILALDARGRIETVLLRDPSSLSAPPPKDYRGWMELKDLAQALRRDTGVPAISISVYRAHRINQATAGMREVGKGEQAQPNDPWSIGSIGKPICSTLVGLLIERGALKWDTTLGETLGDLPMKDGYRRVTLEQIMHHRGGIPRDAGMTAVQVKRIVNGETDPEKIRENYARDLLDREPIAKPGETFAYSNGGYTLLGVVAERTMKKPYEALVKELIFKPLGMKHSFTGRDELPVERPSGHVLDTGPDGAATWRPANFTGPIEILYAPAGGGIWSSTDDLVRFGLLHLNGLRGEDGLLRARTIQRLHRGLPELPGEASEEPRREYACGWGIERMAGLEEMHTHNGSNGTMRAQLSIFPKAGVVVASIVNCGGEAEPSPALQAVLAVGQKFASVPVKK